MSLADETDETTRPLLRSRAVRIAYWVSLAYLVFAAVQLVLAVAQLVTRLARRHSGITLSWDPGFPAPQSAHAQVAGSASLVPGSDAYFTQMTGIVKNVPAVSIVFTSLGDLVAILCGAGAAVCIALLARRISAGEPFARASSIALIALAIVVLAGGEGAIVLHAIGTATVGQVAVLSPAEPDGMWTPPGTSTSIFALWPIGVAAALVALAAVFRAGAAYREDSEGLV